MTKEYFIFRIITFGECCGEHAHRRCFGWMYVLCSLGLRHRFIRLYGGRLGSWVRSVEDGSHKREGAGEKD